MNSEEKKRTSKFLSYVLRHRPDEIGLELDRAGWVSVDVLLVQCEAHGRPISWEQLEEVVLTNDKQRFEFSDDQAMIRARQGHSIKVDLGYVPVEPPEVLYHGTAVHNLESIRDKGLLKGKRHHVHLSAETVMTLKVASRYGKPVLLKIDARKMHQDGHVFYRTGNNVWLTDHVPPEYLTWPET
ncbi:MAG TPA: RNA 2'-phosphotransferase [Phycisphaerae bacterium]|nr:RNA 2'-phosphotransferase [Phycisphaerae bacterium]HRR85300.1 RNA 2'-phosphotransferase [Phycisphaerae bacterium]